MQVWFKKLLLCISPFIWGIICRLTGIYNYNQSYLGISYAIWFAINSAIVLAGIFLIYKSVWQKSDSKEIFFYDYQVPHLPFFAILAPIILCIIILPFTDLETSLFISTVIVGPVIEEFLARGIFIMYPEMSKKEFLVWATISSSTFSLNHWLYVDNLLINLSFTEHLSKFLMHFAFGFLLAGLAYISKTLIVPIVRHVYSNGMVYIYRWDLSLTIQSIIYGLQWTIDTLLLLGFSSKQKKNKNS